MGDKDAVHADERTAEMIANAGRMLLAGLCMAGLVGMVMLPKGQPPACVLGSVYALFGACSPEGVAK